MPSPPPHYTDDDNDNSNNTTTTYSRYTDEDESLIHIEPRSEAGTNAAAAPNGAYDGPEPSISESTHEGTMHVDSSPLDSDIEAHGRNGSANANNSSSSNNNGQGGGTSGGGTSAAQLPRWMREARWSSRSKGVLSGGWIPLPLRQFGRFAAEWSKGPDPPQQQKITPWFPAVQEFPLYLVDRFLPKKRYKGLALATVLGAWLLTFSLVIKNSSESGDIPGYGTPRSLWCGANVWGPDASCGLDGNGCRPFNNQSFAFRCGAGCKDPELWNSRAVGRKLLEYEPFVIGGGLVTDDNDDGDVEDSKKDDNGKEGERVYRGDSFICQAAVHAGVVSNTQGGCGVLHMVGERKQYINSTQHGLTSVSFDSTFPKSFVFERNLKADCGVVDRRWPLLGVTVAFTSIISLFVRSPAVFFPCAFVMLFFHVGLVSDRPNIYDFNSLFSVLLARFLPASLGAYVIYRFSVRKCLTGLTAQVEKTVLWLGAAWVGALTNYTFSFIPIQRLTPHDIKDRPGAVPFLVGIVLIIFAIALGQVYFLRQEGRLRRYLGIYVLFGTTLLIGVAIPDLNVRIHHYILALLLLPGTRTQTRACLLYQGLLVGFYVNGTARWGFASLMETTAALLGSGQTDSLLPNVTAVATAANVTFSWPALPRPYDGISMIVNDVERKRWYEGEGDREFVWEGGRGKELTDREYFRFAFVSGSRIVDYTRAGLWEGEEWVEPEPGRS